MTVTQIKNARIDAAPLQAMGGTAAALMPMELAARMALTWMEGVTRIQGEWTRFLSERLAKDAELQHAIVTCGSPAKAQELSTQFMHRAISDYLAETTRLTAMGAHVADETGPDI